MRPVGPSRRTPKTKRCAPGGFFRPSTRRFPRGPFAVSTAEVGLLCDEMLARRLNNAKAAVARSGRWHRTTSPGDYGRRTTRFYYLRARVAPSRLHRAAAATPLSSPFGVGDARPPSAMAASTARFSGPPISLSRVVPGGQIVALRFRSACSVCRAASGSVGMVLESHRHFHQTDRIDRSTTH